MKEQTTKGKPSAEAVAEYIRSKGYDVADTDMQPLNDDDLENVAGGEIADGGYHDHEWVLTGNEKDDSYYVFWTEHYLEYRCQLCGKRIWKVVE